MQDQFSVAAKGKEGYNSNAGVAITPACVVEIDALGSPPLGKALLAAIARSPGSRSAG